MMSTQNVCVSFFLGKYRRKHLPTNMLPDKNKTTNTLWEYRQHKNVNKLVLLLIDDDFPPYFLINQKHDNNYNFIFILYFINKLNNLLYMST